MDLPSRSFALSCRRPSEITQCVKVLLLRQQIAPSRNVVLTAISLDELQTLEWGLLSVLSQQKHVMSEASACELGKF